MNCTWLDNAFKKVQEEILSVNTAHQGVQDKIRFFKTTILTFEPNTEIVSYYFVKVNPATVTRSREMRQNLAINNFS